MRNNASSHPVYLSWLLGINAAAYAGILLLLTWTNLTQESRSAVSWAVQCLPLLLVLPGMLLSRYRAYSWLCFIAILYFIPTVVLVMSQDGNWRHSLLLMLTVVMFLASAFSSRGLQRQRLPDSGHEASHD